MKDVLRVGTRGSLLAITQTQLIVNELSKNSPECEFNIKIIQTQGDILPPSGQRSNDLKSAFTKRIDEHLLAGEIDIAIHSLKDISTQEEDDLITTIVPKREDARDILVSQSGKILADLPAYSRIGTSSIRRRAQLLAKIPHLQIEDVHGNIDTRLKKVETLEFDGLILAAAGLIRLGLKAKITEFLNLDTMIPAPSQGALGVNVRSHDSTSLKLVSEIDDPIARATTIAERSFSRTLGGNCHVPVAAYAEVRNDTLFLQGLIATSLGQKIINGTAQGSLSNPKRVGENLAEKLLGQGGAEILAELS